MPRPGGSRSERACILCGRGQQVSQGASGAAEHVTKPRLPGQEVAAGQAQPEVASILCGTGQQSAGDSKGRRPVDKLSNGGLTGQQSCGRGVCRDLCVHRQAGVGGKSTCWAVGCPPDVSTRGTLHWIRSSRALLHGQQSTCQPKLGTLSSRCLHTASHCVARSCSLVPTASQCTQGAHCARLAVHHAPRHSDRASAC